MLEYDTKDHSGGLTFIVLSGRVACSYLTKQRRMTLTQASCRDASAIVSAYSQRRVSEPSNVE